jgi:FtsP/CotA-like multicopper oxidase with cupredoxin domain
MEWTAAVTQPHISPGDLRAEFTLRQHGSFMYHPHADEMVSGGMMGMVIIHPNAPREPRVDRDFCFMLHAWDIEPGTYIARPTTMTEFNLWTFNSRVFPGIDPLVVRKGDRVRIRIANMSMHDHPIHIHGFAYTVTETEGGQIPKTARYPEATVNIAVGAIRAAEFVANEAGDWPLHCHKSHHTMNAMGHAVPNLLGVKHDELDGKIHTGAGLYVHGPGRHGRHGRNAVPLPRTLPMMMGEISARLRWVACSP